MCSVNSGRVTTTHLKRSKSHLVSLCQERDDRIDSTLKPQMSPRILCGPQGNSVVRGPLRSGCAMTGMKCMHDSSRTATNCMYDDGGARSKGPLSTSKASSIDRSLNVVLSALLQSNSSGSFLYTSTLNMGRVTQPRGHTATMTSRGRTEAALWTLTCHIQFAQELSLPLNGRRHSAHDRHIPARSFSCCCIYSCSH